MTMSISQIAAVVAQTVAPYIPHLIKGGAKYGEEILEAGAKEVYQRAKHLWGTLIDAFTNDENVSGIVRVGRNRALGVEATAALAEALLEYLQEHPDIVLTLQDDRKLGDQLVLVESGGLATDIVQLQGLAATQQVIASNGTAQRIHQQAGFGQVEPRTGNDLKKKG